MPQSLEYFGGACMRREPIEQEGVPRMDSRKVTRDALATASESRGEVSERGRVQGEPSLVRALRHISQSRALSSLAVPVLDDAADEIARLTGQRDDLLAVLKELRAIVDGVRGLPCDDGARCEDLCGNSWCHEFGCIPMHLRDADAAIAKAEGATHAA